jgi:hypothetical protein
LLADAGGELRLLQSDKKAVEDEVSGENAAAGFGET